MIEWNDSTQLKTKKMPRPLCLLLVGLLAWTILINGTLKLQSQARKRKKRKRRDRFFFFILLLSKNAGKAQFFQHFRTVFQKDKKLVKIQGDHFFALGVQKTGS